MKRLIESMRIFGQVFGAAMGGDLIRPCDRTLQEYRYLRLELHAGGV